MMWSLSRSPLNLFFLPAERCGLSFRLMCSAAIRKFLKSATAKPLLFFDLSIMLTGRFMGDGGTDSRGETSFVFGRQFDNTLIMMICTRPMISFSFRNTPFIHAPFTDGQFEHTQWKKNLREKIQTRCYPVSNQSSIQGRDSWSSQNLQI